MNSFQNSKIESTIAELYSDSKNDYMRMIKGAAKSIFRPMQPSDFKDAYLSISEEQGRDLITLIKENKIKSVVEFGTSFGISTLFLAQGVLQTGGSIITTELVESKAQRALESFQQASVDNLIELRIGDAMDTLQNYDEPIDLLLLDGWKNLYLPLFQMLESNFHENTIVYVDNADMSESRSFLNAVSENSNYYFHFRYDGKVAVISKRN